MERTATRLALTALAMLAATPPPAAALDQPIAGTKIVIQRSGSKEKLLFLSKDPALLFPAIGSADDPGTGTPGGAVIELFTNAAPPLAYAVPAGVGNPGWTAKAGSAPSHRWRNGSAPSGSSTVRSVDLKQGKRLKVVAKMAPSSIPPGNGAVGIRITTGSLRSCAVFAGATGGSLERYISKDAPAPAIADCSNSNLPGPPPPVTTTTTLPPCDASAPACGGTCPAGEQCATIGIPSQNECACIPVGSDPCGTPGIPVCGGACPTGSSCEPVFLPLVVGAGSSCTCLGVPHCQNGFAWGGAPEEGFPFMCYPIICAGVYPTCGGPCGDVGTCMPFAVGTTPAFTGCLCAAPGSCDTGEGFDCPPGETCQMTSTPPFRGCAPP